MRGRISGTGSYAPANVLTNADLEVVAPRTLDTERTAP